MATGTAECPHCASYLANPRLYPEQRYTNPDGSPLITARVSGELITDLPLLQRLRDESGDAQLEINEGVFVSRPKMVTVDLGGGLTMRVADPATHRKAFYHNCPIVRNVVLYDDTPTEAAA